MTKPKDCGCGRGPKHCISKVKRGGQEPSGNILDSPEFKEFKNLQQKLHDDGKIEEAKQVAMTFLETMPLNAGGRKAANDVGYLLELYMKKCNGKPKLNGAALQKDMMKFAEKTLKEMDCGCGCNGMKTLKKLSGGAMRECPSGYTDIGLFCRKNCPDDSWRNDGSVCRRCPPGYDDTGLTCYKGPGGLVTKCNPIDTHGSWWAGDWTGGDCYTSPLEPADSQKQETLPVDYIEKIDWEETGREIERGMEDLFSADGPLAQAFDPEKNGVAESFRKFGEDTKAAFEDVGRKLEAAFDPNQNGVADAFKKLGDDLAFLGDDDWWKDTMSDPDTWIFIVGTIAGLAAMAVSGGTAAFLLGALGPSMNMINSAAKGEPIDPLDIAGLALSALPVAGQALGKLSSGVKPLSSAIPATEKAFMESIKAATIAEQAMDKGSRLAKLGQTLAKGTQAAGKAIKAGVTAVAKGFIQANFGFIDDLFQLAKGTAAIVKNPKIILQALNSSPKLLSSTKFVPWTQLSKAGKAARALKNGAFILRKGAFYTNLGVTLAENGEVIGLWDVPDDVMAKLGRGIRIAEGVAGIADKMGDAALNAEQGRIIPVTQDIVDIAQAGKELGVWNYPDINEPPEDADWDKDAVDETKEKVIVETEDSDPIMPPPTDNSVAQAEYQATQQAEAAARIAQANSDYESYMSVIDQMKPQPTMSASDFYYKYGIEASQIPMANLEYEPYVYEYAFNKGYTAQEFWNDYFGTEGLVMTPTIFEVKYNFPVTDVDPNATQYEIRRMAGERGIRNEDEFLYDVYTLKSKSGSGGNRKSKHTTKMSGTGTLDNDYLAYIGIDDSFVGSGRHASWEASYDDRQREIFNKKMDLIHRRVRERTVKIKPYTERPELLSDTFQVGPHGRDITGQIAGGRSNKKPKTHEAKIVATKLPAELQTTDVKAEKAVLRMAKAAKAVLEKIKAGRTELKGGDWFKPSTWTWESVNPVNWTAEDWTNVAKGADAAIFGVLADPYILAKLDKALIEGGTYSFPPPIGTVGGAALAGILTGAVMAHEYVYPSCEKGQGMLGCNEYRAEVAKVVDTAVKIAKAVDIANDYMNKTSEFITAGIGENILIEAGDIMGNYGSGKKFEMSLLPVKEYSQKAINKARTELENAKQELELLEEQDKGHAFQAELKKRIEQLMEFLEDVKGQGKKRKHRKLKGGDVVQQPAESNKVDFYYPAFSGREARGVTSSTDLPVAASQAPSSQPTSLSQLRMF